MIISFFFGNSQGICVIMKIPCEKCLFGFLNRFGSVYPLPFFLLLILYYIYKEKSNKNNLFLQKNAIFIDKNTFLSATLQNRKTPPYVFTRWGFTLIFFHAAPLCWRPSTTKMGFLKQSVSFILFSVFTRLFRIFQITGILPVKSEVTLQYKCIASTKFFTVI